MNLSSIHIKRDISKDRIKFKCVMGINEFEEAWDFSLGRKPYKLY